MNDLVVAGAIGAVTGSRSMLGPALVAGQVAPPVPRSLVTLLAIGEMAADKHPATPNRTSALPLIGRMVMGGWAAAAHARRDRRVQAAIVGGAAAVAFTFAAFQLRRLATERLHVPNIAAGLVEDALAFSIGALVLRNANPHHAAL
jgi:uncharacterized membrane protein